MSEIIVAILGAVQERGTFDDDARSKNMPLIIELMIQRDPLVTDLECHIWDTLELSRMIDRMEAVLVERGIVNQRSVTESDKNEFPLL